jgi:DNA-binding NarL/FixJ family response regulator
MNYIRDSEPQFSYSEDYKISVLGLLEKAVSILDQYEQKREIDELFLIMSKILSASKMEDHPNIAHVAELIQSITEAFIYGRILANSRALSVLKSALLQVRVEIEKGIVTADPASIEDLKQIIRAAKSDGKDYLFEKKLHVLIIDDDDFAQSKIQKNLDNSINFDSCRNVAEASIKLQKGHYDVILSDFKPYDKSTLDFISCYSRNIPIVSMSILEDPKCVQLAGKAGIMDYILKTEQGIMGISRSLHRATNTWKLRSRISDNQRLLLIPTARKILKELMEGASISQKIQSRIEYNSKLTNSLRDHEKVIQSLINATYVVKSPTQLKLSCPSCKSINLVTNYLCQNCRASNFTRGNVLEHNKCGHADLESNFQEGTKFICPKCQKELKLIGVDYFRIISALKCKECLNIFTIPEISYDCNVCGVSGFNLSDGYWTQMYDYDINPEKIADIKQNIISLSPIEQFLRDKGYKIMVEEMIKVEFGSESYGPFDLIAEKETDLIVISTIGTDIENTISRLIDLDNVGKFEQRRITKYAILFSEPIEVARTLIDKFGIIHIVIENVNSMLSKFKENYLEWTRQ